MSEGVNFMPLRPGAGVGHSESLKSGSVSCLEYFLAMLHCLLEGRLICQGDCTGSEVYNGVVVDERTFCSTINNSVR
jgi:hypothetical protein